jgi:hypothetical protein
VCPSILILYWIGDFVKVMDEHFKSADAASGAGSELEESWL